MAYVEWTSGPGTQGGTYIPWITTGTTTTGTYVLPMTVYGSGGVSAPPARQPTPLEWLDAEVEKTCALARAS